MLRRVAKLTLFYAILFFIPVVIWVNVSGTTIFKPSTTWDEYDTPEEAGFDEDKLNEARVYFNSLNSTAGIAIYKGKVLFAWGDIASNTNAHSVRKSILSGMYGSFVEDETIKLDQKIGELGVVDFPPLSSVENQARVKHLLTSRSGVYLRAGEESFAMRRKRPDRETHEPGSHFYYNNWDFNVLGTIFNNETGVDLFEHFEETIAEPLEMEDFSLRNTEYSVEAGRSIHPSYLFKMSARDMARYGQLFLQGGEWEGEQIIPKDWVEESTSVQVPVPGNSIYDYGYMWWVATEEPYKSLGMYSAVGRYGQSIDIIPEKDLVFVHRVDSDRLTFRFLRRGVTQSQRLYLLRMILDAKIEEERDVLDNR
ncbi:serine hydrolase domain-containing protein [Alteribacter aurantiacus]|uniref:serine hydrolase domain-containing protein n=1 Tax=Alteribacter aurantiacus TaxID=254410 RepID=UPI00040D3404|nr:serine hydrolase [Alteribacter aurantiacus]